MMTIHQFGCRMAARDFHICRAVADMSAGSGLAFVPSLKRKLSTAAIVPDSEIDPLVVTLNSRVEFQVDDEAPQTRIVVGVEFRNGLVGLTLPISTPRGIALLGLRQGQACAFEEGGRMREIRVRRVAWQPQAARAGRVSAAEPRQIAGAEIIDFAHERDARIAHACGRRSSTEGKRK